jgi:hypothetical protein
MIAVSYLNVKQMIVKSYQKIRADNIMLSFVYENIF